MRLSLLLAAIVCAGTLLATSAIGQSTGPASALYSLADPPSQFEWGCFGPCACPIVVQSPLAGTFVLTHSHVDPLFTYYDVSNVRWTIHGSGGTTTWITGSGTYRRGGEVALTEQLSLDLTFDGGPVQHLDSGLRPVGAAFPEIRTELSLHAQQCLDSVLVVDAKLVGLASVEGSGREPSLTVGPNPSAATAAAIFSLPSDAFVDLGVYDLAGRRVRVLAQHEWLTAGTHVLSWDGARADGEKARPGLYLVRLETAGARVTRTAVRVSGTR